MMKRRPFRTVLTELARRPGESDLLLKTDGTVNASALSRAIKCTQATISRALNNPDYQPRKDLIDKLCRYFDISAAQARGEETLVGTPHDAPRISSRAKSFAERFDALPAARKKILEDLLTQLAEPQEHRSAM
jgi:hypothetical protein